MKKANFILIVISVLALAGGAEAFKATEFNNQLYCTAPSNTASNQLCPLSTPIIHVDFVPTSSTKNILYSNK